MKTLPYLKQFTYAILVVTFPFIFSASKDTKATAPPSKPVDRPTLSIEPAPTEAINTIKVTIDSLKQSSRTLIKQKI